MVFTRPKQLHWIKQVQVPAAPSLAVVPTAARDRLVAALAERPRTVAQLAQTFGLSQPTVLEQVRRALRDGLIVEIQLPETEKRSAAERYYAPAVPVIRQPDRDLIESACRALADDLSVALTENWADLHAAFAVTHLAREGWTFDDLWSYLHETIVRLATQRMGEGLHAVTVGTHGLAWIQDVPEFEEMPVASIAPEEGAA
ncbi:MAG: helix-turn-helix domain-containing protein [Chloroflexota bacterium]|nr:helix-turn-helix domain-containing protein [Chloroflexota bacterium]